MTENPVIENQFEMCILGIMPASHPVVYARFQVNGSSKLIRVILWARRQVSQVGHPEYVFTDVEAMVIDPLDSSGQMVFVDGSSELIGAFHGFYCPEDQP